MENKYCPKCNGEMEEGALLDKAGALAQLAAEPEWGQFEKSWVMNKVKNKIKVITYKCKSCGYLESYAK